MHRRARRRGREQGSARLAYSSSLFGLQDEPLTGKISRNEKAERTDPDRHGPLSDRYAPSVEEAQRMEKGDECKDRAGHEQKGALFHRHSFISASPVPARTPCA